MNFMICFERDVYKRQTYHFIVTADHGFIYKRDKLTESDKISGKSVEKAL